MTTEKTKKNYCIGVGKRLQQLRKMIGKNPQQLADELNVTVSHLIAIEAGKENQDLVPILAGLSTNYGVNSAWMISGQQTVFVCKGPKTPQEVFDLMILLPYFTGKESSDLSWLVGLISNPENKNSLYQLHQKLTETANSYLHKLFTTSTHLVTEH